MFLNYSKCDELEAKLSALSLSAMGTAEGIEEEETATSPAEEAMQDVQESKSEMVRLGLVSHSKIS